MLNQTAYFSYNMNNFVQKLSTLFVSLHEWSKNNPRITIAIVSFIVGFIIGTLI